MNHSQTLCERTKVKVVNSGEIINNNNTVEIKVNTNNCESIVDFTNVYSSICTYMLSDLQWTL